MDTSIQNMNKKTSTQTIYRDKKDTRRSTARDDSQFHLRREFEKQRIFGGESDTIKAEPVWKINERPKNPCTRCGLELIQNHLSACKAKAERYQNRGGNRHFARICKRPKTANFRGSATCKRRRSTMK